MSGYRNYSNNSQGGYNRGYNNNYQGGYNNNYQGGYNNNQGGYNRGNSGNGQKKKNGAKKFTGQNGKNYISGWFVDRYAGLVKVLVFATGKSDTIHTGEKNGREWVSMAAKVTYMRTGQIGTHSALLDVQKGMVSIKELNIGVSPGKNWCGFFFNSKN